MQTHLSEQTDEIAWVRSLYPQARDYLDTYEAHGLLGANGLYGHAIHLEPREIDRLAEVGAALVHCPTSNTFIGSGLFDMGLSSPAARGARHRYRRRVVLLDAAHHGRGLRDRPAPRHARCTRPSFCGWPPAPRPARWGWRRPIGRIAPGFEADLTVLDLASTPPSPRPMRGPRISGRRSFTPS
jgi:guanine deaminase